MATASTLINWLANRTPPPLPSPPKHKQPLTPPPLLRSPPPTPHLLPPIPPPRPLLPLATPPPPPHPAPKPTHLPGHPRPRPHHRGARRVARPRGPRLLPRRRRLCLPGPGVPAAADDVVDADGDAAGVLECCGGVGRDGLEEGGGGEFGGCGVLGGQGGGVRGGGEGGVLGGV